MQGPEALGEENLHVAVAALFLDSWRPRPRLDAVSLLMGALRSDLSTYLKAVDSSWYQNPWLHAKAVLNYSGILEGAM